MGSRCSSGVEKVAVVEYKKYVAVKTVVLVVILRSISIIVVAVVLRVLYKY